MRGHLPSIPIPGFVQKMGFLIAVAFLVPASAGQTAPRSPALNWEDLPLSDFSRISPPLEDEKIEMGDQAASLGTRVFWTGQFKESGQATPGLIFRDAKTGARGRFPLPSHPFGLAVDQNRLIVRLKDSLIWIDPAEGTEMDRIALPETHNSQPIGLFAGKLYLVEENRLNMYDPATGQRLQQGPVLPLEKVQRAVSCGGHIYLWSSYGGAKFVVFDPANPGSRGDLQASVSHRLFWKTVCQNDAEETLAVFDPPASDRTGAYVSFLRFENRLIPVVPDLQRLKDGTALRHSPRIDRVIFTLHVTAAQDIQEGTEAVVLLPTPATAEQSLTGEEFPSGGEVRLDHLGNRGLFLSLHSMKKGEEMSMVAYRARLTRYKLDFQIDRVTTPFNELHVPEDLKVYLGDEPQYRINDPYLVEIRHRLLKEAPTVEAYANAVYREIRKRLVYKQDGRFDPAPTVLQNGHGSCTEHSYAQIALLRGAGIPARMAWNWLPVGGDPEFNHKIAEVWLPRYGWVPAEPLAPPRSSVGTTYAQHLIFASLERPQEEFIRGGDRLASLSRGGAVEVKITLMSDEATVTERSILPEAEAQDPSEKSIRPREMNREEREKPERSVQ